MVLSSIRINKWKWKTLSS